MIKCQGGNSFTSSVILVTFDTNGTLPILISFT